MSRTPIDPRLVRTKEQEERTPVLLENLGALFRPFVESVAKPKAVAEITAPFKLDDESYENAKENIAEGRAEGEVPAELIDGLEQFVEILRDPPPLTPEQIEAEAKEMVDEATGRLVTAWIDCIILGVPGDIYDPRELDAATVGDDMFPPIDPEIAGTFDECCEQVFLTGDEARGILRAIKASLPPGKAMPDDAVELLRLHRLTVR